MKSTTRITFIAGLFLAISAGALAAPRSKQLAPSRTGGSGDLPVANLTCDQCMDANAGANMNMICMRGDNLTCGSCEATTRVAARGRPAARVVGRESVIVNNKGEACRFYAVAAPAK